MSIHFIIPNLEFDVDSPVGYYTCLACEKDGTAWSMFTCNDCNLTFHLRCVLIKPVHPTDSRFDSFVCVDSKCIREMRDKHKRKPNEEINKDNAKKPNEEKEIEMKPKPKEN